MGAIPVWFLFLCTAVHGSTVEDINNLLLRKKAVVSKQVRPVFNQSTTTTVYFTYELISIYNFNEVDQKITTVGYFNLWWRDELIDWDPEDYNGLKYVVISDPETWLPKLVLANPSGKSDVLASDWQVVRYGEGGWGSISPKAVYESTCSVDVTYYPWDEQVCELYFVPWGYSRQEVSLVPYQGDVSTTFFTEHGEWELVNATTMTFVNAVSTSVATIRLRLRRRPTFCVVNALLPVVFMSFLNTFVFMIPARTGERFSFSITVLLSIAVFLTLIGDNLPKTSQPMSFLSYYLVTVLSVSVSTVLASIMSARLFWRGESFPVSKPWYLLSRLFACRRPLHSLSRCGQRALECEKENDENDKKNTNRSFSDELDVRVCCRKGPQETNKNVDVSNQTAADSLEHRCYCPEQRDSLPSTFSTSGNNGAFDQYIKWEDVSMAFDRACFLVFMACDIAFTAIFLFSVS